MSINYQQIVMQEELRQYEQEYNVEIKCLIEREALGTAGPIGLAAPHLLEDNRDGLFFVLNSDIVCHYEFDKMIERHRQHQGVATLCVKEVEDPSKFGVVVANESG
mmetsp:Transcript_7768/g.10970  ORF Transcript_7768/g.10970 Transcript_7768/m.10970 type:complete len:106 (+) Transcript_7768:157-474(+)